ncbi:unnamed protein product [Musa acuminata subsp. malaccensis]|uniref:(wild Malaysian banana) hypothetical protein n=1 Tax=Musa acuminata subsp. malaccensis TaxID=214687 RepID=A0A804KFK2_MUSAM|nr:unnamed protein product [Musa acuminata subsp. malaccensis]
MMLSQVMPNWRQRQDKDENRMLIPKQMCVGVLLLRIFVRKARKVYATKDC